ncbi:MAG: nucleoside hydrolase [Eudoraea sp.]|nr:nucleoside hydrolase [Eudoraea sp.]
MRKLIIDTDPGIDDSMAIQFAFASGKFDVIGLTTVYGNVGIDLTTSNAARLLNLLGKSHVPIARGASDPLNGKFSGGVAFIHGEDGQGNTWGEDVALPVDELPAHDFILKKVHEFPGEVTIAALGPLTNLAKALKKEPGIQELVKEVVFMGGNAFCEGNATPAAEANILSDPVAADDVLGASWPITMVGLDVTQKTVLSREVFNEIAKFRSPVNDHVTRAYLFYLDFYKRVNKMDGTYVHDASVFAYLLNKNLYRTKQYPIRVDIQEGIGKGKTWPSIGESDNEGRAALVHWQDRPKINICVDVDGEGVIRLLKEVITQQNL